MSEVLISVSGVSKKFCRDSKYSMFYGLKDIAGSFVGMPSDPGALRNGEFWSVDDVSFELRRGDCLGLIGPNGAGKSTLLKMLNGIIMPDKGRIEIRGRVGAMIEVGAGFHPMLSGRENIYINGAILGFSKAEIDAGFDEIVEFAELRDFIDSPVKHYSSGMYVRLGFAIAAQMKPDILLIDEVLAVGDVGFRAKCYNHLAGMLKDTAVVIVSHSIPHIDRYCNKVFLLAGGRLETNDDTAVTIERYYSLFDQESSSVIAGSKDNSLRHLKLAGGSNDADGTVRHGGVLKVSGEVLVERAVRNPNVLIAFLNRELQVIAVCRTSPGTLFNTDGLVKFSVEISPFLLNVGDYKVSLIVYDEKYQRHLLWHNASWNIRVTGDSMNYGGAAVYFDGKWGSDGA